MFFKVASSEVFIWNSFCCSCIWSSIPLINSRVSSDFFWYSFCLIYSASNFSRISSNAFSSFCISSRAEETWLLLDKIRWFNSAFRMEFCSIIDCTFSCSRPISDLISILDIKISFWEEMVWFIRSIAAFRDSIFSCFSVSCFSIVERVVSHSFWFSSYSFFSFLASSISAFTAAMRSSWNSFPCDKAAIFSFVTRISLSRFARFTLSRFFFSFLNSMFSSNSRIWFSTVSYSSFVLSCFCFRASSSFSALEMLFPVSVSSSLKLS